jgi:hypothetical protein
MRVRNTRRTMGGPMSGKIRVRVEAKKTAMIHDAVANVGRYCLG